MLQIPVHTAFIQYVGINKINLQKKLIFVEAVAFFLGGGGAAPR